jgi:hypothetical protein
MAHPEDLDGEGGRRSRKHTELLVCELELGALWNEYDLVGDIALMKVCLLQHPPDVSLSFHRYTSPQFKDMFLMTWYMHFPHSWISATLRGTTSLMRHLSTS